MLNYHCLADVLDALDASPLGKMIHLSDIAELCSEHEKDVILDVLEHLLSRKWVTVTSNRSGWALKPHARRYVGKDAGELLAVHLAEELRKRQEEEDIPVIKIERIDSALYDDLNLFRMAVQNLKDASAVRAIGPEGGINALMPLPGLSVYGRSPVGANRPDTRDPEKRFDEERGSQIMAESPKTKRKLIENLITKVRALKEKQISYDDPQVDLMTNRIRGTVAQVFGADSAQAETVEHHEIWKGVSYAGEPDYVRQRKFEDGIEPTAALLAEMLEDVGDEAANSASAEPVTETSKKIFIVHGRNHSVRDKIDLYLSKELMLETEVMEAGAHGGRTLPEKFEEMAGKCGFAIFILTADDQLKTMPSNKALKRARQNVILEVGYFWGALGRRDRVAFLVDDDPLMELPSDIKGIGYIRITKDLGETKLRLLKELKAAGFVM